MNIEIDVPLDENAIDRMMAERTRAAGSSFYWGMRILDVRRRRAMYAIYAFAREVDDIADGSGTEAEKLAGLDYWGGEIGRAVAGQAIEPIGLALVKPIAEFGLARDDFQAIIDGCAMDARGEMRRPSAANLDLYCDRVACAVGRLSVRVFGEPGENGLAVAASLGRALQFTNILRDLVEDAAIGRLYLPDELLAKHGIAGDDPAAVLAHPALPQVCAEIGEQARRHFDRADQAMARCARRTMRPAALMGAMYRDLLNRMAARNWAVAQAPVRVPRPAKLWYVLRHGLV